MPNLFRKSLESVPPEIKASVSKSFDITDQILDILERKGISQKDFAAMLGKNESEVSKWMKGTHNFTEETIAKIEIALGESVTLTVKQAEEKYGNLLKEIAVKDRQLRNLIAFLNEKGIEPGEYSYAMGA